MTLNLKYFTSTQCFNKKTKKKLGEFLHFWSKPNTRYVRIPNMKQLGIIFLYFYILNFYFLICRKGWSEIVRLKKTTRCTSCMLKVYRNCPGESSWWCLHPVYFVRIKDTRCAQVVCKSIRREVSFFVLRYSLLSYLGEVFLLFSGRVGHLLR